jgi:hypothetical protein
MTRMADNTQRLVELIQFDPAKPASLTQDLLSEVVKDLSDERLKAAKTQAREWIAKAIDLRTQMHKAQREFNSQMAKFEKELGKILNQVEGMLRGRAGGEPSTDEGAEPSFTPNA